MNIYNIIYDCISTKPSVGGSGMFSVALQYDAAVCLYSWARWTHANALLKQRCRRATLLLQLLPPPGL